MATAVVAVVLTYNEVAFSNIFVFHDYVSLLKNDEIPSLINRINITKDCAL